MPLAATRPADEHQGQREQPHRDPKGPLPARCPNALLIHIFRVTAAFHTKMTHRDFLALAWFWPLNLAFANDHAGLLGKPEIRFRSLRVHRNILHAQFSDVARAAILKLGLRPLLREPAL